MWRFEMRSTPFSSYRAADETMSEPSDPAADHPRGTLVIVGAFGALVVVGWLLFFFGLFLPRLTP